MEQSTQVAPGLTEDVRRISDLTPNYPLEETGRENWPLYTLCVLGKTAGCPSDMDVRGDASPLASTDCPDRYPRGSHGSTATPAGAFFPEPW